MTDEEKEVAREVGDLVASLSVENERLTEENERLRNTLQRIINIRTTDYLADIARAALNPEKP